MKAGGLNWKNTRWMIFAKTSVILQNVGQKTSRLIHYETTQLTAAFAFQNHAQPKMYY